MMKRIQKLLYPITAVLLLNLGLIYFQSCQQDFSTSPDNSSQFPAEIDAIFNTPYTANNLSCSTPSCHATENDPGGYDLTDWSRSLKGSKNGTMIIPYNGYWSHLISYLNADTNYAPVIYIDPNSFQYTYHKLDSVKLAVLMNWINAGAKSKTGEVAFSNVSIYEKGFITNQAADVVAVVKPDTKQVIRLIPVGGTNQLDSPHYLTIDSARQYFYVSLIKGGFVEKYRLTDYVKTGSMQAGEAPAHIIITPDGQTGYVSNFTTSNTGSNFTKFNPVTMTVTEVLSNPRFTGAHGMALSRDGQYLYTVSEFGEYLFKISTAGFDIDESAPIDPTVPPNGNGTGNFTPYQVVLSPDNNLLYVSCLKSNEVRVYSSANLSQVDSYPVGKNPLLMTFTNDGKYLFVCNRNDSSVSVINPTTHGIQTITDAGVQPHGVDMTADGNYAIISCETQSGFDGHHPQVGSNKVGVSRIIQIQGSNFTLLEDKLEMGSFPAGIAIVK